MERSPHARRLRATGVLAMMVMTLAEAHAALAQEQPLPPVAQGEIVAGATQPYILVLHAGDITSGTLELKGTSGSFVVSDPQGHTISKYTLFSPGRMRLGFLAPTNGPYRIQIVSRGSTGGSYALRLRTRNPEKAANAPIIPTVRHSSERIKQLAADLLAGRPGALSRFWDEAAVAQGTFIEPIPGDDQNVLATFLWRATYATYNVRLNRPPESTTSMDYYLSRLPDTDVWYKTMKVHRTTRFEYRLSPNHLPDEEYEVSVPDPLNPPVFPADIDHLDWAPGSIFVLPGAPTDTWATTTPSRRGSIVDRKFDSPLLKAQLALSIYTPPDYATARGPYPLVVIFDGPAYNSDVVKAPTIVDNLIAAGKIRPAVVCFVSSVTNTANRAANLQLNATFSDAIATELVPWLRNSFAITANPADRIIGGFSAGANSGLFTALRHPEIFGGVLSQDGAGGVGRRLPQMFLEAPRQPLRVYMVGSLYTMPDVPVDELAATKEAMASATRLRDILLAKGYEVTYREVGATHDWLYVRTTLPEALIALLGATAR